MARTAEQIIREMLAQKDIHIAQQAALIESLQEQIQAATTKPSEPPRLSLVDSEKTG